MKKIIIEIEYNEKKFEDSEEEDAFLSHIQMDIDNSLLSATGDAFSTIKDVSI